MNVHADAVVPVTDTGASILDAAWIIHHLKAQVIIREFEEEESALFNN